MFNVAQYSEKAPTRVLSLLNDPALQSSLNWDACPQC